MVVPQAQLIGMFLNLFVLFSIAAGTDLRAHEGDPDTPLVTDLEKAKNTPADLSNGDQKIVDEDDSVIEVDKALEEALDATPEPLPTDKLSSPASLAEVDTPEDSLDSLLSAAGAESEQVDNMQDKLQGEVSKYDDELSADLQQIPKRYRKETKTPQEIPSRANGGDSSGLSFLEQQSNADLKHSTEATEAKRRALREHAKEMDAKQDVLLQMIKNLRNRPGEGSLIEEHSESGVEAKARRQIERELATVKAPPNLQKVRQQLLDEADKNDREAAMWEQRTAAIGTPGWQPSFIQLDDRDETETMKAPPNLQAVGQRLHDDAEKYDREAAMWEQRTAAIGTPGWQSSFVQTDDQDKAETEEPDSPQPDQTEFEILRKKVRNGLHHIQHQISTSSHLAKKHAQEAREDIQALKEEEEDAKQQPSSFLEREQVMGKTFAEQSLMDYAKLSYEQALAVEEFEKEKEADIEQQEVALRKSEDATFRLPVAADPSNPSRTLRTAMDEDQKSKKHHAPEHGPPKAAHHLVYGVVQELQSVHAAEQHKQHKSKTHQAPEHGPPKATHHVAYGDVHQLAPPKTATAPAPSVAAASAAGGAPRARQGTKAPPPELSSVHAAEEHKHQKTKEHHAPAKDATTDIVAAEEKSPLQQKIAALKAAGKAEKDATAKPIADKAGAETAKEHGPQKGTHQLVDGEEHQLALKEKATHQTVAKQRDEQAEAKARANEEKFWKKQHQVHNLTPGDFGPSKVKWERNPAGPPNLPLVPVKGWGLPIGVNEYGEKVYAPNDMSPQALRASLFTAPPDDG